MTEKYVMGSDGWVRFEHLEGNLGVGPWPFLRSKSHHVRAA